MADTKISALTELTAGNTDVLDELVIVDKSDTSMGAGGTTKRVKRSTLDALYQPDLSHGTVFPSSPADGDIFIYDADTTNGVKWQFQYRSASGSAYKWEFMGGPPLTANVDAANAITANGSWNDPTTGINITLPLAGDYFFEYRLALLADASRVADAGVAVGASNPGTALERFIEMPIVSTSWYTNSSLCRVTGIAAATVAKLQFLQAAGTLQVRGARLTALPIRTSG